MPILKHSASKSAEAFNSLQLPVQRWVRRQGWGALRAVQEAAIPVVLEGGDCIVAAATASGKTEAAFLPLVSRILAAPDRRPGYRALYLCPLKALINDQYDRLESLCSEVRLPLHKWHGDVSQSAKNKARRKPGGVLLITPESLEAMLVRRGSEIAGLFHALDAIVIDELHAFIGSERGLQLLSLMSRIERAIGRQVDRIGLSATLGDMKLAARALRPAGGDTVAVVEDRSESGSNEIDVTVHVRTISRDDASDERTSKEQKMEQAEVAQRAMALHLFEQFHGKPGLIFANSRNKVEEFSYLLREACEARGIENSFLPHHGKLSKELREDAEHKIKNHGRPQTIIATSTLEMGVDIGSVDAVGQIGAPSSIAATRQRVGRSGRRDGQRPCLRLHLSEVEPDGDTPIAGLLHLNLIQSIAVVRLLQDGWCEPPNSTGLHFSTLLHQILAMIAQHAGCSVIRLYQDLCIDGPFHNITPAMFQDILRSMAHSEHALIEQAADGRLLLGAKGEKRIEHFTFYAVFPTPEEFRVVFERKTLGTIEPLPGDLALGAPLPMAGRRWEVADVNVNAKVIQVRPASGPRLLKSFARVDIHEQIARTMRDIYLHTDEFDFLDDDGMRLLANARFAFQTFGLADHPVPASNSGFELYPWSGTRQLRALSIALRLRGITANCSPHRLEVKGASYEQLISALRSIASANAPKPVDVAANIELNTQCLEKYDYAVPPRLRNHAFLVERTDLSAVPRLAESLLVNLR